MDSPNNSTNTASASASFHSSTAADGDYDSRAADSLSALFPDPIIQRPSWSRSEPDLLIPSETQNSSSVGRNPKKRARASRRAPTTVLTTDTTNFRAMVQEFTGIPEPPFTSRTRLDLFPNTSSFYTLLPPSNSSTALSTQFLSSSSSSSSSSSVSVLPPFPSTSSLLLPSHSNINNSSIYQLSSDLGINMNNNNNNLPLFRMGGFGVNHVHGSGDTGLHNMVSTSSEWAQRRGAAHNDDGDAGGVLVSSANFVINNSEPSVSTNNGDKEAARTQGMVESWINCSSH